MRILVITNLYPPAIRGGYEILCQQVCNELATRGHDVHVLTTATPDTSSQTDATLSVQRTLKLYLPFDAPARMARGLRRKTSQFNYAQTKDTISRIVPDIVFVWSQLRLTLGAARAAEDSHYPVLYAINDTHPISYCAAPFSLSPLHFLRWLRDAFVFPDITLKTCSLKHITCISTSLRDSLRNAGVHYGESRVIYQGIPLDSFPVKESPGIVSNPASILYTGQLYAYKGVHTLLKATAIAAENMPGRIARISIVGSGDAAYTDELKGLANKLPVSVDFIERVPHEEMPAIYRSHDIFVFPSIWDEPFGLTHIEAMASGTPVITTSHGGHSECFTDGENALFFEKGDENQLAVCIHQLIEDAHIGPHLAQNARILVEKQLSLSGYVDKLENYLKELAV